MLVSTFVTFWDVTCDITEPSPSRELLIPTSRFENSCNDGLGNGSSERVHVAVGLIRGEVSASVQTERSIYLGRLVSVAYSSLLAVFSFVPSCSALVADVHPSAILFLLVAFTVIPLIAWFILLPIFPFLSFPSTIIFGGS